MLGAVCDSKPAGILLFQVQVDFKLIGPKFYLRVHRQRHTHTHIHTHTHTHTHTLTHGYSIVAVDKPQL